MTDQTKSITTREPRDQSGETVPIDQRGSTAGTLYRFISTLDADVHITAEATDDIDGDSFSESESLPIGGESTDPDADTKLVTAGDSTTQGEATLLTENWPWIELTITPQSTPTTGSVEVRSVKNF